MPMESIVRTSRYFSKKSLSLVLAVLVLVAATPVRAHVMTTGVSRWCFGNGWVVVDIDLDSYLIGFIKGIKDGKYNPDAIDPDQLPKIAKDIIQPYINERLHLTINNNPCPLRVIGFTKSQANLYSMRLFADNIKMDKPKNSVKIEYRLLFQETNYAHQNVASMYTADGTVDPAQRFNTAQQKFDASFPKWQAIFNPSGPEWEMSIP